MTEMAESGELERFLDALWMERGLSANTLAAYRRDLAGFLSWLKKQGDAGLLRKEEDHFVGEGVGDTPRQ